MTAVAEYIKTLAYFMIFTALVEIITPSGCFKKYIRLIMSILLIAVVLEPVGRLSERSGFLERMSGVSGSAQETFTTNLREDYDRETAELVLNEYKKGLEERAKGIIEARKEAVVNSINVVLNSEYGSEAFGEILGVHIDASIPAAGTETDRAKRVLLGNAVEGADFEEVEERVTLNIKKSMADFYNVSEDNIHIIVRDIDR